jgi:hypothetical protein
MLERTDAIMNEVLEPITFVLAYPTVVAGSSGWCSDQTAGWKTGESWIDFHLRYGTRFFHKTTRPTLESVHLPIK